MFTTNAIAQNTIGQIWNQIKDLSREDRSSLVLMIEKSLDDESSSDETMEKFVDKLDDGAMQAAADFAYLEGKAGTTIPHTEVLDTVKAESMIRSIPLICIQLGI